MVDRRRFLIGLGTGIAGLNLPVFASLALSCKIIGIGGAGCNLVVALRKNDALTEGGAKLDYVCVDLGQQVLRSVEATNHIDSALKPIKALMLAPFGAGGRTNAARAACLRHRAVLAELLSGSDLVVLVAGLGGGTGSGVTPIMARLAKNAGAVTIAAVVTPFDYEGARLDKAARAIGYLQREADLVLAASNSEWVNRYPANTPMMDVFTGLEQYVAEQLRVVLSGLKSPTKLHPQGPLLVDPCSKSNSTFTPDRRSV